MKEIKEFLYGKSSKEQMEKFSKEIAEINEKFNLKDKHKIENNIVIDWNARNNQNSIKLENLDENIISEINTIFNKIFR